MGSPFCVTGQNNAPKCCGCERGDRPLGGRAVIGGQTLGWQPPCHFERSERGERSREISILRQGQKGRAKGRDFSIPLAALAPVEMTGGRHRDGFSRNDRRGTPQKRGGVCPPIVRGDTAKGTKGRGSVPRVSTRGRKWHRGARKSRKRTFDWVLRAGLPICRICLGYRQNEDF